MRNLTILLLFILLGNAVTIFSQQNDSLRSLQTAIESAKSNQEKAQSLNLLAEYHFRKGDLKSASECTNQALSLSHDNNFPLGVAAAQDNLGAIYEARFDYINAIKSYHAALEFHESNNQTSTIALSKFRIGKASFLQGDHENALANLDKSLELNQEV
jgi:tetratricopeptide (TPR) repeat protein